MHHTQLFPFTFSKSFVLLLATQLFFDQDVEAQPFTNEELKAAQAESLRWHNIFRSWHQDTPTMTLDDELNQHAQAYAEKLVRTGKFALTHDGNELNRLREGENLFGGRGGNRKAVNDAGSAARAWYFEFCNPKKHPRDKTSHFTQLVWKDSVKLGVGVAANADRSMFFVSARYKPQGNIQSKSSLEKNVMPLRCDESQICNGMESRKPINESACGDGPIPLPTVREGSSSGAGLPSHKKGSFGFVTIVVAIFVGFLTLN